MWIAQHNSIYLLYINPKRVFVYWELSALERVVKEECVLPNVTPLSRDPATESQAYLKPNNSWERRQMKRQTLSIIIHLPYLNPEE